MMLGVSKNIQSNPSCQPHQAAYGHQMVDHDASIVSQSGTYLGTDPAVELNSHTYSWEYFNVSDTGPITNSVPWDHAINLECSSNDQAGRFQFDVDGDLAEGLQVGDDYSIHMKVRANWIDASMVVRLWTTFSTYLTTDLEGSPSSIPAQEWGTAEDVDVWKWIGAKFTQAGTPYISVSGVTPLDPSHVFSFSKIYLGKKL